MSVLGGEAQFSCSGDGATGFQWLLNDTTLDRNTMKIMDIFSAVVGSRTLRFVDLPLEYNMTSVACNDTSSRTMMVSNTVCLLIQGDTPIPQLYS